MKNFLCLNYQSSVDRLKVDLLPAQAGDGNYGRNVGAGQQSFQDVAGHDGIQDGDICVERFEPDRRLGFQLFKGIVRWGKDRERTRSG